jgi:hypothetical protein
MELDQEFAESDENCLTERLSKGVTGLEDLLRHETSMVFTEPVREDDISFIQSSEWSAVKSKILGIAHGISG